RIAIEQRIPGTISDDDPLAEAVRQLAPTLSPDHVQLFYSVAVHSRQELSLAPDEYAGFVMACLRMLALLPEPVSAYVPPPAGPSGSDTAGAGAAQAAPAPATAPAASELASAPATSTASVEAAASAAPVQQAAQGAQTEPSVQTAQAAQTTQPAVNPQAASQQAQASAPAAAPVADVARAHAAQAAPVAESIPADDDFVPAWEDAPEPAGAGASYDSSESAPADANFDARSATSQPQEAATAVADSSAVEAVQAASTPSVPSAQSAAESTSAAQADSSADPVTESSKAQGKSSAQPLMAAQAQAAARVDPVAEEAPPVASTQDGPAEPAWLSEGMDEEFENYQPLDMDAARAEEDGDVPSVSMSDRFMPDTELGLPVPQSGSDSPRTVRLGGMKPETWPDVATSLPLSGWAAELARQSEWLGVKGQEIH